MSPSRGNNRIWGPSTLLGKSPVLRERDWLVLALLLFLSVYMYSHWIWRPVSPDERNYLAWGFKVFKEGVYEGIDGNPVVKVPPLHPYAMAAGFHLFGPSVDSAQAMSMVFGCLTVGLTYLYGATFWGWRVGLMAALLLLTAAKGEFWRYSNRVLNEVHLTFFVLLTIYWLALVWQYGRLWMAAAVGVSLGLGLLTKEFVVLLVPIVVVAVLARRGGVGAKALLLATVFLLTAAVLLPWVLHVKEVTGSLLGGTAQRAQGQALEVVANLKAWGLRSPRELSDMIRFFDKPSWIIQVLYMSSLVFGVWMAWRRRSAELLAPLGTIGIWYLVFSVFLALPLDLRRVIPLLPLYSLLSALLLDALWERMGVLAQRLKLGVSWLSLGFVCLLGVLLVANLRPSKVLRGFEPLSLFSSSVEPYYEKQIRAALSCIPSGSSVLSNYPSLTYFYSQGAYPVRKLRTSVGEVSRPWLRGGTRSPSMEASSPVLYDFKYRGKRVFMDEESFWQEIGRHDSGHLIFIQTGHRALAPRALEGFMEGHKEVFVPLCSGDKYRAYRIDRSALPAKRG